MKLRWDRIIILLLVILTLIGLTIPGKIKRINRKIDIHNEEQLVALEESLIDTITDWEAQYRATAGVSIYSTNDDKWLDYNATKSFVGASTTKMEMAVYYANLLNDGKINLDTQIPYESYMFEGGDGILQGTGITSDSVDHLLNVMIRNSDNIGYNMLHYYHMSPGGSIKRTQYASSITEESVETWHYNLTTAKHLTKLMMHINTDDNEYYPMLIEHMQNTTDQTRLKSLESDTVTVGHKIGEYTDEYGIHVHDTGIVITENNTYYMTILTNQSNRGFGEMQNAIEELLSSLQEVLANYEVANHIDFFDLITNNIPI